MNATDITSGRPKVLRPLKDSLQVAQMRVHPVVFVYLICVVIPIAFQAGPMYMTTLRLVTLALIIPLMLNLMRGKYGPIILTDILFVAHLAWMGIALWVNNPSRVIEQVGSVGVEFLGGYMIGRAYIRTSEDFGALCRFVITLVIISTPLAIYETQTGRPLLIEYLRRIPGITSVSIMDIDGRMGLERVQSSFAHPIHFGLFCSVAFSLCYVGLQGLISDAKRYTFSAMVLCTGLLALSSGALLAMVMQIIFIVWNAIFEKQQKRWWILLGICVSCYVLIDILSNRSPIRVFMSYATFSAHNAYYRGIIFEWGWANIVGSEEKGIVGSPVFGIGMNNWVRPGYMTSGSMDNFWLVIGVRYGLPGFFTLAVGYLLVIFRIMFRDFSNSLALTQFRRAWVFTFMGLTFTLCTVHVWTNIYSFVTFMFGAGVWLITAEAQRASENPDEVEKDHGRGLTFTRFSSPGGQSDPGSLVHSRGATPVSRSRAARDSV